MPVSVCEIIAPDEKVICDGLAIVRGTSSFKSNWATVLPWFVTVTVTSDWVADTDAVRPVRMSLPATG